MIKEGKMLTQNKNTEIQRKDDEIQRKDREIQKLNTALNDKDEMLETLRSDMSKLQIRASHSLPKKVSKQCSLSAMFQVNKSM